MSTTTLPETNQKIAELDRKLGAERAKEAFGTPVRLQGMAAHPTLRPNGAYGVPAAS